MIRTENEYQKALDQLRKDAEYIRAQREHLQKLGITGEQLERALHPALSFREQLKEEVESYERMKRGDLGTLRSLTSIGRWLIGMRIARGWSQKELAERLNVSEAQVSRDERNEYHGITVERAQRILEVMDFNFRMEEDIESSRLIPSIGRSTETVTGTSQVGDVPKPNVMTEEYEALQPSLTRSVPDQVAVFLRADRNLNNEAADRLAQIFRLAYEAVATNSSQTGKTKEQDSSGG